MHRSPSEWYRAFLHRAGKYLRINGKLWHERTQYKINLLLLSHLIIIKFMVHYVSNIVFPGSDNLI